MTKRRIWILVIACAALFIAVFPAVRRATEAKADGQLTTCWVMCRPGDYVNVRVSASRKSRQAGYLECGDSFLTAFSFLYAGILRRRSVFLVYE